MAVLLAGESYNSKAWSEVGRTDTVANSLSAPARGQRQTCFGLGSVEARGVSFPARPVLNRMLTSERFLLPLNATRRPRVPPHAAGDVPV